MEKFFIKLIKFILVCACVFIATTSAAKTQRIAVLDLETINTSKVYAKIVRNILEVGLYKTKKYQIVERKQIKLILKEQGLQMSGCVDSACAVKIGKILSADYMVIGSLHKIKTYTITIKLVDVAKGTIFYADSSRAESDAQLENAVYTLIEKFGKKKRSKKMSIAATERKKKKDTKDIKRLLRYNADYISNNIFKKYINLPDLKNRFILLNGSIGMNYPHDPIEDKTTKSGFNVSGGVLTRDAFVIYGIESDAIQFEGGSHKDLYFGSLYALLGVHITLSSKISQLNFNLQLIPFIAAGIGVASDWYGVEKFGLKSGLTLFKKSMVFIQVAYIGLFKSFHIFSVPQYNIGYAYRL